MKKTANLQILIHAFQILNSLKVVFNAQNYSLQT